MKKFAVLLMVLTSLFFFSCGKSEVAEGTGIINLGLGGGVKLDLVLIRPGTFLMGSEKGFDDEKPVHEVTISQPFYLGKYEVTQAQWKAVMGSNPSGFKGATLPVEQVSWEDCQEFIEKLNSKGIGTFRLPTEAEWEYACRAGTTGDYAGNLDEMAWYETNSGKTTHPVGTKKANPWGLYDMHGNVWEWCQDWYGDYPTGAVQDPAGAAGGSARVNRGGSWNDNAGDCLSASRLWYSPSLRIYDLGFRLVRAVQ
jgi:formylglycine-generating enzyme required for sulfatase activity